MKNNTVVVLFTAAIALSCSTARISYDYDKQADFKKYKTYTYADEADNLQISSLDRDRIKTAVDNEMTSRGFTKSDNADALVDLHVNTVQKESATATTSYSGMGSPWSWGYGTGFTTTQIDVNDYTEGTLFINVVDKASNNIVWQGRATKTLSENASPEKREANINQVVSDIFKKYPVPPQSM